MEKYNRGKIYKIVNDINGDIYVGSTTNPLYKRMIKHVCDMKRFPNYKIYIAMKENGIDHFSIILIELYPCSSLTELRKRENHFIFLLNPALNTNKAFLSKEERLKYNRNYSKQCYAEHKEECILKYHNYYYEKAKYEKQKRVQCQCGKTVNKSNISYHLKTNHHKNFINSI